MSNRKFPLISGEYYHVFTRGVDKRNIVNDKLDIFRFLESLKYFNTTKRIGSMFEHSFRVNTKSTATKNQETPTKLVDILAYNILDNHYHLLLRQREDSGISKFMQSFNGGYTKYFNNRHNRVGPLFQGKFRAEHISDDNQLVYVSAYVNLNHVVHSLGSPTSKWGQRSSWEQYSDARNEKSHTITCCIEPIVSLRKNLQAYCDEAEELSQMIAEKRRQEKIQEESFVSHLEVGLPSG